MNNKKEFLEKLADLLEEYKVTAVSCHGLGIDICFNDDTVIGLRCYNEIDDIRQTDNTFKI